MELFSEDWARAWRAEINADPDYAEAGRSWTGGVVLRSREGDATREVFVDLEGGVCLDARVGTPSDEGAARIVIAGPEATWRQVLAGEVDPVLGLVRGLLALEKGSLVTLLPHQQSARQLLKAAVRVGAPPTTPAPASPPPAEAAPPVPDAGTSPRRGFQTLSAAGLDHASFPMVLYHKAKRLGVWDPRDIDLSRDRADWAALDPMERDLLLRLSAFFQAGEEAVARDLLPLIQVVSDEGRLEEEMYLTTFLFEEAKHVEVFRRFLDEVAPDHGDLERFESPSYRHVFVEELPAALHGLARDSSPRAQVRASVTYNMIVEGVLAETGYRGYQSILESRGILPGMQEAVRLVKRDESRHIAFGLYLISRLVAADPSLWDAVESDLGRLVDPALGVVREIFQAYEVMPFGLAEEDFTAFALQQFQARLRRLDTARRAGRLVEEED